MRRSLVVASFPGEARRPTVLSMPLDPPTIAKLFSGVTKTMLDLEFVLAPPALPTADLDLFWSTAVVALPGRQPVAIGISSSESGCLLLGAAMFACELAKVEAEMARDAISELANIAAGEVKRTLRLDQAIALPKLLLGKELGGGAEAGAWRRVLLRSGAVRVVVSISTNQATVEEHTG